MPGEYLDAEPAALNYFQIKVDLRIASTDVAKCFEDRSLRGVTTVTVYLLPLILSEEQLRSIALGIGVDKEHSIIQTLRDLKGHIAGQGSLAHASLVVKEGKGLQ
jgi:hypothetical protein